MEGFFSLKKNLEPSPVVHTHKRLLLASKSVGVLQERELQCFALVLSVNDRCLVSFRLLYSTIFSSFP